MAVLRSFAARDPHALEAGFAWADQLEASIIAGHPVLSRIREARAAGPHAADRLVELAADLLERRLETRTGQAP